MSPPAFKVKESWAIVCVVITETDPQWPKIRAALWRTSGNWTEQRTVLLVPKYNSTLHFSRRECWSEGDSRDIIVHCRLDSLVGAVQSATLLWRQVTVATCEPVPLCVITRHRGRLGTKSDAARCDLDYPPVALRTAQEYSAPQEHRVIEAVTSRSATSCRCSGGHSIVETWHSSAAHRVRHAFHLHRCFFSKTNSKPSVLRTCTQGRNKVTQWRIGKDGRNWPYSYQKIIHKGQKCFKKYWQVRCNSRNIK